MTATSKLILASSSPFRQQLLKRLGLPFRTHVPDIDESAKTNESAYDLALRLAVSKAEAVANYYPDNLIIGSDQIALLHKNILGKPLTHDKAIQQLRAASGNEAKFYTAIALCNSKSGYRQSTVCVNSVFFRLLSDETIERYLQQEQPYQCAGSFKAEGLGISLFTRLSGDDPNALIGLPLIKLVDMLAKEGVFVP